MIPAKAYNSLSYKQLQTTAKVLKIPANLKKCYLIELLTARNNGDEVLAKKIIKNAYEERVRIKEFHEIKSNQSSDAVMVNSNHLENSNTELEKLLKAPTVSKNSEMDINIAENKKRTFSTTKNVENHCTSKKRKSSRGRPCKNNIDTISVESSSNHEYERDKNEEIAYYNKDCKMCSETSINTPSRIKIRKISDTRMKINEHENKFFVNSSQPDEFISIDSWNNYENRNSDDNGIINLSIEDSEICNSNYVDLKSEVILDTNNDFICNEYERSTERQNIHLNYEISHASTINDPVPYNSHFFPPTTSENRNSKNCDIKDQNIKSYSNSLPGKRSLSEMYTSAQQSSNLNFSNYQQYEISKRAKNISKINEAKDIYQQDSVLTMQGFISPRVKNNCVVLRNGKLQRVFEINNNDMNPSEEESCKTIEVSDHSYSTPFYNKQLEIINGKNISIKNKFESFNRNPLIVKNFQTDQNINIFDDIQNIDLKCDISEEISSTLEEYFSSLDIPANSDVASKIRSKGILSISEKESRLTMANDWNSTQSQRKCEIPYTPMIGKITSMICPICNWFGRFSLFEEHVRKQHTKYIFKSQNGILSISINVEEVSKHSQQYFIEHGKRLFIIFFKYKYPDIIQPIILSIPQYEYNIPKNCLAKFFLQINNLVKNQENLWSGWIECMNTNGRPLNVDVFSNRKHGRFEISMRSLDLVPSNITINNIPQFLSGCVVEIHIFIETTEDIRK